MVSRIAAETDSDNDIGEIIPQLDGPAEETLGLKSEKEAMEEDSGEEAERDISHLPTANDPDNILQHWMNNIDQEKIENMSQEELKHMNAVLAQKTALRNATEKET